MELHGFLSAHESNLCRIQTPISIHHEITALQHQLEKRGQRPIILVEKPVLPGGDISSFPVVCNLTASRQLIANLLKIDDFRQFARCYQQTSHTAVQPQVVDADSAPCQEVVLEGDEINLKSLPALVQHHLAPGPYLTAAHVTTYDPDTLVDNTAIQRCWIKEPRKTSLYTYPTTHNSRNIKKFWAKNEPCPIAVWIGHHPLVVVGSQSKLKYPESHWVATSSFIGEPLPLVPSRTHGQRIMVPAEAEIVIEGWIPVDQWEADGPFGEYTGYVGPQTLAQTMTVSCLTHRGQAIYHDYGSGLPDMLAPDNMLNEAKLYGMIKAVCPSVINVHVPEAGHRFVAYIQMQDPSSGEARDALMAALAYRRLKTAVVFDEDIDLYDEKNVTWAIATRVHWQRDMFTVGGLSGSKLDPAMLPGASTAAKIGIDATLPARIRANAPRSTPPIISVDAEALNKADQHLSSMDASKWPKI